MRLSSFRAPLLSVFVPAMPLMAVAVTLGLVGHPMHRQRSPAGGSPNAGRLSIDEGYDYGYSPEYSRIHDAWAILLHQQFAAAKRRVHAVHASHDPQTRSLLEHNANAAVRAYNGMAGATSAADLAIMKLPPSLPPPCQMETCQDF